MKKFILSLLTVVLCLCMIGLTACSKKHEHSYTKKVTPATCTTTGFTTHSCSCGDKFTTNKTPSLGHTEISLEEKPATCVEDGLTAGIKCSTCNEILVSQESVPAIGHTETALEEKPATCIENGLTAGVKCTTCNEILVAQEVIQARGQHGETDNLNKCTICNSFCEITMNASEKTQANKVENLLYNATFDRTSNSFIVYFAFEDENENYIKSAGCISYYLTDRNGNVLYENYAKFREADFDEESIYTLALTLSVLASLSETCTDINFKIYNVGYFDFDFCNYTILWSYDDLNEVSEYLDAIDYYMDLSYYYYQQSQSSSYMSSTYYSMGASAVSSSLPYIKSLLSFINGKVDLPSSIADDPCFQQKVSDFYDSALSVASATSFNYSFAINLLLVRAEFSSLSLDFYSISLNLYS